MIDFDGIGLVWEANEIWRLFKHNLLFVYLLRPS